MFASNRLTLGLFFPLAAYAGDVPDLAGQAELAAMADKGGFSALWTRDVPLQDPTFGDLGQVIDPFVWMGYMLNHTIIWCRSKQKSATFLTDVLGLPPVARFGPMLVVQFHNGISLDFYEKEGEISSQHYSFLISEDDFDQIFARICSRGVQYWADPGKHHTGEINRNDGGRGVYFEDPDGHLLELITRPYGSEP
jgi:catechol 2,3-dioxygenase-like lactoylglutathione lyase family enzyme